MQLLTCACMHAAQSGSGLQFHIASRLQVVSAAGFAWVWKRSVPLWLGDHSVSWCCSDEELVRQAKEWTILGKDLVAQVTCSEPYEWQDATEKEWEFSPDVQASNGSEPLHVRASTLWY